MSVRCKASTLILLYYYDALIIGYAFSCKLKCLRCVLDSFVPIKWKTVFNVLIMYERRTVCRLFYFNYDSYIDNYLVPTLFIQKQNLSSINLQSNYDNLIPDLNILIFCHLQKSTIIIITR